MQDSYLKSLEEENKLLRSQLTFDAATGLYNLRSSAGKTDLESRIEFASRFENPPSIVFTYIDLDGLHPANKLYGSDGADRILYYFAQALKNCSRLSDFAFREGNSGDEFGIVFFDFDIEGIENKIRELDKEFLLQLDGIRSDERFTNSRETPDKIISFSSGITKVKLFKSSVGSRSYTDYENIFGINGTRQRAEEMCSKAKKEGKNRFVSDLNNETKIIREGFNPPERTQFDN